MIELRVKRLKETKNVKKNNDIIGRAQRKILRESQGWDDIMVGLNFVGDVEFFGDSELEKNKT